MTLSTEAQTNLNNILTALDEQMQTGENNAFQAALKYQTVLSCLGTEGGSIDVSTLAKEATLSGISNKLSALSDGTIPVNLPQRILAPDKRLLTANTTIPSGSIYI